VFFTNDALYLGITSNAVSVNMLQENLREELFSLEDPKHCYNKTGVDAENEENEVNLLYEQLYEVKLKRSSLNLVSVWRCSKITSVFFNYQLLSQFLCCYWY